MCAPAKKAGQESRPAKKAGPAKKATRSPQPGEKVVPVRCQPLTYPCPTCGRLGHRRHRYDRFVRSIAYGAVVWLHVFYAEYRARCDCRKYYRSCPPNVCPKADYDNLVREAVLNRVLEDGLNVQRTLAAMRRDFRLELSSGFVYDCLTWGLARLSRQDQRRRNAKEASGTVSIDELHLGEYTLLLCTDPIADRVIGYSLVKVNDQPHMRRFLRMLQYWGLEPRVVVTDGSNLYPAALAEVWPAARHQLCVFHVLQDVTKKVLDAVRRLRRGQARRGNGGRKRRRGRPGKGRQRRRQRRGPTLKEKAAFVFKRRFLVVKRPENLSEREGKDLGLMFEYLPELRVLRGFCLDVYRPFSPDQVTRLARRRRTLLLKKGEYEGVPELEQAMGLLNKEKFDKMIAFLDSPAGQRVRTNNHVERANRKIRFDEKVRYKFRSERSLGRFLRLRLDRLDRQPSTARPSPTDAQSRPKGRPASALPPGRG
jgi:transposase-like protein